MMKLSHTHICTPNTQEAEHVLNDDQMNNNLTAAGYRWSSEAGCTRVEPNAWAEIMHANATNEAEWPLKMSSRSLLGDAA